MQTCDSHTSEPVRGLSTLLSTEYRALPGIPVSHDMMVPSSPAFASTSEKNPLQQKLSRLGPAQLALLMRKLDKRIARVPHTAHLTEAPLSYAQERLWFLDQFEPQNAAYHIPGMARVKGALSEAVLEQALNEMIRRHAVLRTSFVLTEKGARQIIHAARELKIDTADLRGVREGRQWQEMWRVAREEAEKGFDLSKDLLLRVKVVQLDEEERVIFYTMHHIISDGWSMAILLREVATLYEAFKNREPSPLRELNIQYANFAVWQREWLQARVLEEQLEYWQRQLAGAPEVLELPTCRPRPPVQTYAGSFERFTIGGELRDGLKRLTRQEDVTLFMLLLAAFNVVLRHFTKRDDLIVGTDIANRDGLESESLIGFFVNQLVLRTNLEGNPTFQGILKQVRTMALGAYAHQDLPFELLVKAIKPERKPGTSPLFQIKMLLQNFPSSEVEISDLRMSPVNIEEEKRESGEVFARTECDLTLVMLETASGLSGRIQYRTDLYNRSTIRNCIAGFEAVLGEATRDPGRSLKSLEQAIKDKLYEELRTQVAAAQKVRQDKINALNRKRYEANEQRILV